ncbi:hypothetical protein F3Y22_tig00109983pilonHSYRG00023 [Hibiscus syriacus]|uniref:RNase H type-1 domain-containing protein n=1 Tax=Hibiscus syriacus TaxID=106335 RepID=A0A6A3BPU1_HIBSY|nr:hypothetical protein F3Y22_tig00109983pilonHSYRG00023 [Hibiscus syriacus]
MWARSKWSKSIVSINDFILSPMNASNLNAKAIRPLPGSWIAPPMGSLKMNVEAAVLRSCGAAGIGGILRDPSGACIMWFSRTIGSPDILSAELTAILEAGQLVSRLGIELRSKFQLKSDSLLAVRERNVDAHIYAKEGFKGGDSKKDLIRLVFD